MKYTLLLVAALASLVAAQNGFTMTTLSSVTAGTPFNITWAPSTGTTDTVTLVLRQGDQKALNTVETIAASIQNTGSYLWTPSPSLVAGKDYAFEIVDDGNTAITNYSNQFTIISTNTVSSALPSSTSSESSASSASSASASSGSSSGKSTSSGSSTSSASGLPSVTGSKTSSASKTSSSTGTASTTAPTGNAAVALKASGAVLGLVGLVMAAL